jgi:hypothetical protein
MLDDVADYRAVAKPAPRSPDTKAALAYLDASGADGISITASTGRIVIAVGFKPDAIVIFWLPAGKARAVAARARSIMGDAGDVEGAISALQEAVHHRVRLTEHQTVIARAGNTEPGSSSWLGRTKVARCAADFAEHKGSLR